MNKGDKCWIIENGSKQTMAEILSIRGNFVLIKVQNGKVLRLPRHRIFCSEEEASKLLTKLKNEHKKTRFS